MAHTPGPWRARKPASSGIADYTIASKDKIVAFCPTGRPFDNVLLIASAPDLLDALKRTEQTMRNLAANLDGDLEVIARNEAINLRDDIAKAEAKDE